MLVITDDPLQCLMLILPCVVCAGIVLNYLRGNGSYFPGERPRLTCDYSNVSDAEYEAFFRNGIELRRDDDYDIYPCSGFSSCQILHFVQRFDGRLSGNYTCNVTSGSQVIASNTLPVASACKLFSGLPSSPFNIESILTV